MATTKKSRRKAKKTKKTKTKKTKKRAVARKAARTARRPARKKAAVKRKAKRSAPKPRAATAKSAAARPAAPAPQPAPPPGERIGIVTHYYGHLSVAIVQIETGTLRVGEMVRIKGHTSDFTQPVESMEVNHMPVNEAHAGQSVGVRVREHAREHDVVYKVVQ